MSEQGVSQPNEPDEEIHFQLYMLLAFAIQELSYYASRENVQNVLLLPSPDYVIANRAQAAVERIEQQNPHFFQGYIKYRRGKPYPPLEVSHDPT
jgi:hypothetical protein